MIPTAKHETENWAFVYVEYSPRSLERAKNLINSSKVIRKQTITTATQDDAWKAWTTVEGVTSFFVPKANIELVVGGRYELFSSLKAPKGFQGTEGCKVLSLEPPKNLAFEFIAPPQFPNVRRLRTRLDVIFDQVVKGGVVKVDLVHSGFFEGEEWDEFFEFSNWNWDLVLGRFQYRFSVGPIDWNDPYFPQGLGARPERKLRDHISV